MSAEIFVATESAVLFAEGRQHVIHKGSTRIRAGHPLLKRNSHLFKPLDVHFDVEQATAAPGEQRNLDLGAVRAWAKENGVDVPARGKIPAAVLEQYEAAQRAS
ncbi:hypothetical protein BAY59_24315 [Prauserella coralliicola]|nr:hypothetical protein BAY59_24315 [Prauserella coralliicola]